MGKWIKILEKTDRKDLGEIDVYNPNFYMLINMRDYYFSKYIYENETSYPLHVNIQIIDNHELKVCWEDCHNFTEHHVCHDDFFLIDEYGDTSWSPDWLDFMVEMIKERGLDYTQYINDTKQALIQRCDERVKESIEEFTKEGLKQQLEETLEYINKKYLNKTNENKDNLTM